jgi:hypothetical protein
VASLLPNGTAASMPELTHFGPLEDPEAIAASIATAFL